jgi:hypothetical protein
MKARKLLLFSLSLSLFFFGGGVVRDCEDMMMVAVDH